MRPKKRKGGERKGQTSQNPRKEWLLKGWAKKTSNRREETRKTPKTETSLQRTPPEKDSKRKRGEEPRKKKVSRRKKKKESLEEEKEYEKETLYTGVFVGGTKLSFEKEEIRELSRGVEVRKKPTHKRRPGRKTPERKTQCSLELSKGPKGE